MNTTYFLNQIMGNVFGTKKTPTLPDELYLGVSTTTPSVDGTGVTEPTSGGYSRVKLSVLSEPNNGVITNDDIVALPESTGNWGVITHYVVYDAITGGNLLVFTKLATSRTVEASTTVMFRTGDIQFVLENMS